MFHFPTNTSPKNGFKGFFSDPMDSLREQYCDFKVEINHLTTANIRNNSGGVPSLSGSVMKEGSKNKSGCSAQYSEYSVNETGERMNGGAVKDERSPLNDEIDFKNEVHDDELAY